MTDEQAWIQLERMVLSYVEARFRLNRPVTLESAVDKVLSLVDASEDLKADLLARLLN